MNKPVVFTGMDRPAVRQILSYLLDHPDAEDSVEGIAEWWILDRCVERRLDEVRGALEELAGQGLLIARRNHQDELRYGLNNKRLEDARSFIETHEASTGERAH